MSDEQAENLARVERRIDALILEWCTERLFGGAHEFRLEELESAVRAKAGGAPDSTSRILRLLRAKKRLDYVVVKRSESLYRLISVGDAEAEDDVRRLQHELSVANGCLASVRLQRKGWQTRALAAERTFVEARAHGHDGGHVGCWMCGLVREHIARTAQFPIDSDSEEQSTSRAK